MLSGRKFHGEHFLFKTLFLYDFIFSSYSRKCDSGGAIRATIQPAGQLGCGTFRGCLGHLTWHIFTKSRFPPKNVSWNVFFCLYRPYKVHFRPNGFKTLMSSAYCSILDATKFQLSQIVFLSLTFYTAKSVGLSISSSKSGRWVRWTVYEHFDFIFESKFEHISWTFFDVEICSIFCQNGHLFNLFLRRPGGGRFTIYLENELIIFSRNEVLRPRIILAAYIARIA